MPATFDTLAPTYDEDFTNTQIGRYMRDQVHQRLLKHFHSGDHVLELGCGTGEDALFLAENGINITATDASEGMLEIAQAKIGDHPRVTFQPLDLRTLSEFPATDSPTFDGVYSNFGVINCLDDWRSLASWLAERVHDGGTVGFGVMAPYCVWEVLWHGAHLNLKTATRRFRNHTIFSPQPMLESIHITYPTIQRLTQDFAPFFQRVHVQPLGVFLPPSDVYGMVEKRPWLLKPLMHMEKRAGNYRKFALFADHYWIEFRRVADMT